MSALVIVAPSDAQLAYIAGLCEERGLEPPAAVYSKSEAPEIIAAISRRDWIVDRDDSEPPAAERYAGWLQGAQSPRDAQRED